MKRLCVLFVLAALIISLSAPAFSAAVRYKEAPSLAALVKARKLPSVVRRLPAKPLVVKPLESVGKYGGIWRMGMKSGSDDPSLFKMFASEPLVRWNTTWSEVEPNLAESWTANDKATEFVFHLREGIKWSDGKPFTADDIVFWWNDVEMNKELAPSPPNFMQVGGKPGTVTKVDDYTVMFTFVSTHGLFLNLIAGADGRQMHSFPAHYAKQFHASYVDKAKLDALVKKEGYNTWRDMFIAKVCQPDGGGYGQYSAAGIPTLYPYMVETPMSANATQVTFVRNPYYWKVDPTGQQYPYIDRLVYTVFQDTEQMLLKAVNGEIDMQGRHFNTNANKAVLFDNQDKGNYSFFLLVDAASNRSVLNLNLTHKDKAMRAIFQNKDFRIGLSYAINRKEIINTVFIGQGKPAQVATTEGTPFYNKQLATQYTEYDVKLADEYLTKAGLGKKDGDGMRLRPDGQSFSFVIEVPNNNPEYMDSAVMMVKYLKAVGIRVEAKLEDRALVYARKNNNDIDAMIWGGEGGLGVIFIPRCFFPTDIESFYAVPWGNWYQGVRDNSSEEPPAEVKKMMEIYDSRVKGTADPKKQVAAMNEILQLSADWFPTIGISTSPTMYGIVKNNMKNVPRRMINAWTFPSPAVVYNTFTFYYQ